MGYMGKEAIIAKIPSYNNYNLYILFQHSLGNYI